MIQLDKKHYEIVNQIVKKYPYDFFVFGSRAKGTANRFSDLDLCIKNLNSLFVIGKIKIEMEDSDLPFKVDLIAWDLIDQSFQESIQDSLVKWE